MEQGDREEAEEQEEEVGEEGAEEGEAKEVSRSCYCYMTQPLPAAHTAEHDHFVLL